MNRYAFLGSPKIDIPSSKSYSWSTIVQAVFRELGYCNLKRGKSTGIRKIAILTKELKELMI
jgi:hypothetical protein